MEGPIKILDGFKVLEVAEGIPGPVCCMQLADLGADVIKVEPKGGDRARKWFEGSAEPVYAMLNRGKRSVELDVTVQDDRDVLMSLVDGADAVVVHLDPEVQDACGIDWRAVQADRPKLIVCEITDLGRTGELAGGAGSELVTQAMAGFMRYAGSREFPCRVGYEIASVGGGMHAVQAVLAALFRRNEDGEGDYCHLSLLGQLLSLKTILLAAQGDPDAWAGFHLNGPHWEPDIGWETSDGQVTFDFRHGLRDAWAQFCRAVGLDQLPDDSEYDDWRSTIYVGDRKSTHGGVYRPHFKRMSSAEASDLINGLGGISVKFHDYGEFLAHPQLDFLDAFVEVGQGGARQVGTPFRFEGVRISEPKPAAAPALGEAGREGWRATGSEAGA